MCHGNIQSRVLPWSYLDTHQSEGTCISFVSVSLSNGLIFLMFLLKGRCRWNLVLIARISICVQIYVSMTQKRLEIKSQKCIKGLLGGSILSCCSRHQVLPKWSWQWSKQIYFKSKSLLEAFDFWGKYPFFGSQQWNCSQYNCPLY